MASRPAKTAGNTTYTAEVAAGATTMKASEVDGDLNEIFTNITNVNVATGAAIATAKLAQDAGIQTGHLAAGAVTTTILANQPNGVTSAKLNINATNPALSSGQISFVGSVQNTTQTLITLASMTTRGGRVLLIGTVSGQWIFTTSPSNASWILLRDGVAIATWNQQNIQAAGPAAGSQLPGAFSPIFVDLAPSAGAHVYRLDLTVSGGVSGATFSTNATQPGFLFAMELA